MYLIQHADLRGFQPEEVEMMAFVARYHRKALPKKSHTDFQVLPKKRKAVILKLAALLRLAEGLDRSHYQNIDNVAVTYDDETLTLTLAARNDPELDVWGTLQHRDLFESVYGLQVNVEARVLEEVDGG
jgi:exopolyphosphatase/guanosine-5'-triphosphate,3'-diphosphate pyrophosphatase